MFYIESESTDQCFNFALEEYLLTQKKEGDLFGVCLNAAAVNIGINQNVEEEINLKYVEEHNLNIMRRKTGGGAGYVDPGCLTFSFITDERPSEDSNYRLFSLPVCRALKALGVPAEFTGRNDILVDGKKVSGACQRIINGRLQHSGSLIFDTDIEAMAAALKVDPEKFKSKSAKSVKARVGNLKDYLPQFESIEEFKEAFLEEFFKGKELIKYSLTEEETQIVNQIAEQYRSWEWTYGRNPGFEYNNKKRFPGGTLAVSADIREGIISGIIFTGDFMATTGLTDIEAALTGARYEKSAVKEILQRFDLEPYFGSITADEITEVLLP